MTTTPAATPPGWYPAPDGSGTSWWWDGGQWVQPPQVPAAANPTTLARLALATQILLVAGGAVAATTIAVEGYGVGVASDYLNGNDTSIALFDLYDQGTLVGSIAAIVATIATAVLWAVWQFHAAKHVAGQTRRTPGWHAGSWFIPIVCWWFPYQNISDLWRAIGRVRPTWQIAWWVLWLAGSAVSQLSSRVYLAAEDLEQLRISMWLSIVGELLTLAAVPLACLIVRGITQGIVQRAATPAHTLVA
ncbi:DUF4328 domain-containing protein [Agromyces soli]|uniref:DUF4328 domain-containing protein n=1 Tax=Agromyces soli TaxID=659012 RepID=A0ABY4ARK7_9MICO|nr:DUF4328 domain-containing protein [Agromyces soli]UOE25504.1 DUF4328 domain-containing protein [Agromyces soli]